MAQLFLRSTWIVANASYWMPQGMNYVIYRADMEHKTTPSNPQNISPKHFIKWYWYKQASRRPLHRQILKWSPKTFHEVEAWYKPRHMRPAVQWQSGNNPAKVMNNKHVYTHWWSRIWTQEWLSICQFYGPCVQTFRRPIAVAVQIFHVTSNEFQTLRDRFSQGQSHFTNTGYHVSRWEEVEKLRPDGIKRFPNVQN